MRSKITFIIMPFVMLCYSGCFNQGNDIMQANGLQIENESYSELFVAEEKRAFLLGRRSSDAEWRNGSVKREDSAVVYHSAGDFSKWDVSFLEKGSLVNVKSQNGESFIVTFLDGKSKILKFNKDSGIWEILFGFDGYVGDIYAYFPNRWIISVREGKNGFKLFESINQGHTWHGLTSHEGMNFVIQGDRIFYLTFEVSLDRNVVYKLIKMNRKGNTSEHIQLPAGFIPSLLELVSNKIWVAGVRKDQVGIYRYKDGVGFSLVSEISIGERTFPKQLLYLDATSIFLVVGERKSAYVESHLMKSSDDGSTWSETALYRPHYPGLFAITKNGYSSSGILSYRGEGIFQHIEN